MSPTTSTRPRSPRYLPTPPNTPPSNTRRRRSTPPRPVPSAASTSLASSRITRNRPSSSSTSSRRSIQYVARLHTLRKLASEKGIPRPPVSAGRVLEILARKSLEKFPAWDAAARKIHIEILETLYIESEEWLHAPPQSSASSGPTSATGLCSWISTSLTNAITQSLEEEPTQPVDWDTDSGIDMSYDTSANSHTSFSRLSRSTAESIAQSAIAINNTEVPADIITPIFTLLRQFPPATSPPELWLSPLLSFLYIGAFQNDPETQREALNFLPVLFSKTYGREEEEMVEDEGIYEDEDEDEDERSGDEEEEENRRWIWRLLGREPMFWVAMGKFSQSGDERVRALAEGVGRVCRVGL